MWDGMNFTQDKEFEKNTLQFKDFIYLTQIKDPLLPDHDVVAKVFRHYRASWIQPIAVFDSKNAGTS